MAAKHSFYATTQKGARLFLRVTPGANRDEVAGLWAGADGKARLAVKVSAPPDKGRANAAVAKLIADRLGVAKSAVAIVAGDAARLKTVEIKGDPEMLAPALARLADGVR